MRSLIFALCCVTILIASANLAGAQTPTDPGQLGNYTVATTSVAVSNPGNGHSLATTIYYPSSGSSVNPSGAPYPTLVFSHGFQSQPSNYAGDATHLASWGYIVAIPSFSDSFSGDNLTPRISDVRAVLTYLETQNANYSSLFYQRIDTTRLGVVGHSLGGTASLGVAGQDNRVKAVVALDPASGAGMSFGSAPIQATAAYTDFVSITAPALIVGTPSNSCNGSAEYNTMYADIGAEHKSKQVIANGNHCDFLDPTNSLCYTFCGGGSANPERLTQIGRAHV
jgi:predicted dienelactone hydrolase